MGLTGDGLGSGVMNTTILVTIQMSDNPVGNFAAKVCADYSVSAGGIIYGDWYLPSKYELNLLYLQKNIVGGFASVASASYWTSNELYSLNGDGAVAQYFISGGQNNALRSSACYVRAIRAF